MSSTHAKIPVFCESNACQIIVKNIFGTFITRTGTSSWTALAKWAVLLNFQIWCKQAYILAFLVLLVIIPESIKMLSFINKLVILIRIVRKIWAEAKIFTNIVRNMRSKKTKILIRLILRVGKNYQRCFNIWGVSSFLRSLGGQKLGRRVLGFWSPVIGLCGKHWALIGDDYPVSLRILPTLAEEWWK